MVVERSWVCPPGPGMKERGAGHGADRRQEKVMAVKDVKKLNR